MGFKKYIVIYICILMNEKRLLKIELKTFDFLLRGLSAGNMKPFIHTCMYTKRMKIVCLKLIWRYLIPLSDDCQQAIGSLLYTFVYMYTKCTKTVCLKLSWRYLISPSDDYQQVIGSLLYTFVYMYTKSMKIVCLKLSWRYLISPSDDCQQVIGSLLYTFVYMYTKCTKTVCWKLSWRYLISPLWWLSAGNRKPSIYICIYVY